MSERLQFRSAGRTNHGTRSDVSEAMMEEINREMGKAIASETMEIVGYVLDMVFQADPQRALSGPLYTPNAGRKTSRPLCRSDSRRRVNGIRHVKRT
jgi:hypothetical protein